MDKILITYTVATCFPVLYLMGEVGYGSADESHGHIDDLIDDVMMAFTLVLFYAIMVPILCYYMYQSRKLLNQPVPEATHNKHR